MKNIHVLPTDKPSRLVKNNLGIAINEDFTKSMLDLIQAKFINLYITSDEKIKEVNWFMSDFNSFPIHNIKELSEREGSLGWKQEDLKNNLKIILTTDQDLIKDGVQAIDDEFLEWFVKNPSCEWVEVVKEEFYSKNDFINGRDAITYNYKIIIPSEEVIQVKGGDDIVFPSSTIITFHKPKQETLEEAAANESEYLADWEDKDMYQKGFIEGAKWQQERMYSEEDMKECVMYILRDLNSHNEVDKLGNFVWIDSFNKWFEQFKKK